jgi:adenylate cyclase
MTPAVARGKIFEILVQVAKTLIVAREVNEILSKVMDLTFEYLQVDRAAVVLLDDEGRLIPMLARERGKKTADAGSIFSHTIVENVVRERVALLTSDALADGRFEAGQSIRIQQIRSAMCVPLWNLDRIIGALHVDTPLRVGTFNADDLDLLTALGNFAAVAIERARLQKRIEQEGRIRERLSRYHSPAVVEEIVSDADGSGRVETVRTRDVTVWFADIVGFTTAAEKMEPEALSRFLGTVFTFAADAIFAEGGTLDKFIGDAVMAFFGAPIAHPDHARRAIAAASKLIEEVREWNAERLRRGESAVAVRIGINTGRAVVGDIGSDRRVDYTVLGNTVNVASRLEEHVAGPNEIIVGAETARQGKEWFRFEPLGDIKLKGLTKGLGAFRVLLDDRGVPFPP